MGLILMWMKVLRVLWRLRLLKLLGHAIVLILLILSILVLICYHDFFHLVNRYSAFYINPLALNDMLLFQFEHKVYTMNIIIGDEAEPPWFVGPFVRFP